MGRRLLAHLTLIAVALAAGLASRGTTSTPGQWMAGDFHQHTYFTDGSNTIPEVLGNGVKYGLDWAANSEHGGTSRRDGAGKFWDDKTLYASDPIKGDRKEIERTTGDGDAAEVENYRVMWRWQSLIEFAYPLIQQVRRENPKKLFATGLEWNVPGHEHCSVGIVSEDATAIGEFEYRFDRGDGDTSGGPGGAWAGKQYNQNEHAKAVEATQWMQENHPENGWIVFAHPERASSYTAADFRDFNDAGPTVAFGFEGMPGHQKNPTRGGYRQGRAVGDGTYGGAGYYIASVGGLWDALLGEGRNWWTFVSSDFHSVNGDFWPGQYAKTWTFVPDNDGSGSLSLEEVAAGLRSGATFCTHGDLISALDFRVESGPEFAGMGQTLEVKKRRPVEVKIRFRLPDESAAGGPSQGSRGAVDLRRGQRSGAEVSQRRQDAQSGLRERAQQDDEGRGAVPREGPQTARRRLVGDAGVPHQAAAQGHVLPHPRHKPAAQHAARDRRARESAARQSGGRRRGLRPGASRSKRLVVLFESGVRAGALARSRPILRGLRGGFPVSRKISAPEGLPRGVGRIGLYCRHGT